MNSAKIGIDAGGTLVKIAYTSNETTHYQYFLSRRMDDVVNWLYENFNRPSICVTGGKSQMLAEKLDMTPYEVLEFDATAKGIEYLARQQKYHLGNRFLFVNVGTGTSLHFVQNSQQERTSGSGVGGGTMLGLAYLTTGISDFEQITRAAQKGNSDNVDLKVKDIFEGAVPPISGDLTASNFGKLETLEKRLPHNSDTLASIIRLVGEVIASVSIRTIEQYDAQSIIFVGSTFLSNPLLQAVIEEHVNLLGKSPVFLDHGAHSGALGALLAISH